MEKSENGSGWKRADMNDKEEVSSDRAATPTDAPTRSVTSAASFCSDFDVTRTTNELF